MKVICNKCGRVMQQGEVLTHAGIYLLSITAPIVFKDFILKALETQLGLAKRSFFDDSLAAIANSVKIECSKCKYVACWNPCPDEDEVISEETTQENAVIK
jgi:hypothetical protein